MIRILFCVLFSFLAISLPGQKKDAELLNYEKTISIKNSRLYKTEKIKIRINTVAGEKFTRVTIPYSGTVHVSDIDAYIEDAIGTRIKSLKKSDITDKSNISDMSFYQDSYVKEFTLKHNILPYTLCYSYNEEEDEFLLVDYWQPVLDTRIPTIQASLSLEVPSDFKIAIRGFLFDSFTSDTAGKIKKYKWSVSYGNNISDEVYSPPAETFLPTVIIVPLSFRYIRPGSQESWSSLGNWCNSLIANLSDLPPEEISRARDLVSGAKSSKEIISILYHYLQDAVRYINISIKTGGLKPYPASYVARNKYGDCKALSNYFRALLEAAGIQSYYTLVRSDYPIKPVNKSLPFQQFDHVIVSVPVENDTLWLDCTNKLAFGYTGSFIQNRDAFVVTDNNSHFGRIPALSSQDVTESRKMLLTPSVTGSVACSVNHVFRGTKYEAIVDLVHNYNESEKEKALTDYLSANGLEVSKFSIPVSGRDVTAISISYSGRFDKLIRQYGNDQVMSLPPSGIPRFEDPSLRKLPVQIDFPVCRVDTIVFAIPEGSAISSMAPDKTISGKYGTYSVRFERGGKSVSAIRIFILNKGNYALESYKEFYDFIKEIRSLENSSRIVSSKKTVL